MAEDDEILEAMDAANAGKPWDQDCWPWRKKPSSHFYWAIFQPDITYEAFCVQASFFEFARVAEYERFRILPTYDAIGIKAFLSNSDEPMVGEHIFLTNIFTDKDTITGTLDSDSRLCDDFKEGEEITFPMERVSDWFLVRAGRGIGGFTLPYVWDELTESEQEQFRDEQPFVWFKHRGTASAMEELVALRKCSKCNKRDLFHPEGTGDLCGICASGSWRCNCPKCGAPLIRNKELPKVCARCYHEKKPSRGGRRTKR